MTKLLTRIVTSAAYVVCMVIVGMYLARISNVADPILQALR